MSNGRVVDLCTVALVLIGGLFLMCHSRTHDRMTAWAMCVKQAL